jgi:hypothetical protein
LVVRVLLRLERLLEGRATSRRGYAGDTAGTKLEGATMRYIARDTDKLPTTDHAGEREPREPAAEFGHYAEKGVRPA